MPTLKCPLCHSIDQVQRVTAIVEGETHDTRGRSTTIGHSELDGRTDYYAGTGFDRERVGDGRLSASGVSSSTTNVNITQQSRLAKKLVRPYKPVEPPPLDLGPSNGEKVTFLVLTAILALAFWYWLWFVADVPISGGFGVLLCFFTPVLAIAVGGLVTLPLGLIYLEKKQRTPEEQEKIQQLKEAQQAEDTEYEHQLYRWELAMERWDAMFYCRRCDAVYIPGDTYDPRAPEEILDLAYSGIE